jgi:oxygen-independent coproporphyrinogen-3 oxidase
MQTDLIQRLDRPVPRYTSYPTAAQFHPGIGPAEQQRWVGQQAGRALALYLHVPFCRSLCHYCACHTAVVRDPTLLAGYADAVAAEAALLAPRLPEGLRWAARQWGGGTPTQLGPANFLSLSRRLDRDFPLAAGAEHSVELDPRAFDAALADALAEAGVTRASLGVQDFDPAVQQAIHRQQDVAMTAGAIALLRARGIRRINLDLVYGLPRQSLESLDRTLTAALGLAPDRIAVFGYAHVPWMKRHQRLIDERTLPGAAERHAMATLVAQRLGAAGFVGVGLDHYARPDDPLARASAAGLVSRSFQGYSDLPVQGTLGLGASAISAWAEGYAQNHVGTRDYLAAIRAGRLATARGVARSADDRLRGRVIERLLCDLAVDLAAEAAAAGEPVEDFAELLPALRGFAADGLLRLEGWRLAMTQRGRPWVRSVAALFDRHLRPQAGRHARAV